MTVQPTRNQLRALADAATPGPWEADHSEEDNSSIKERGREWWDGLAFAGRPDDAEFIAAARTAVPQLLDQLDQAEAELDSWMARAYEAEQRAWQAEARIEAWEKQYAHDLEQADAHIDAAEAQIKAVQDLCDDADKRHASVLIVTKVRRALDT